MLLRGLPSTVGRKALKLPYQQFDLGLYSTERDGLGGERSDDITRKVQLWMSLQRAEIETRICLSMFGHEVQPTLNPHTLVDHVTGCRKWDKDCYLNDDDIFRYDLKSPNEYVYCISQIAFQQKSNARTFKPHAILKL